MMSARAFALALALALTRSASALNAGSPLPPLAWTPLPHGALRPEGWLRRQLRIQADGLSGAFESFWEPVANAQWTGGTSTQEDWVEIFP